MSMVPLTRVRTERVQFQERVPRSKVSHHFLDSVPPPGAQHSEPGKVFHFAPLYYDYVVPT